ncbi:MAG: SGNH/GDSL hydrolase family protein [Lentimicrobium sp.]|nr:SGNH/GDSL hydrolase family protein [Lentimicrobium sp.]
MQTKRPLIAWLLFQLLVVIFCSCASSQLNEFVGTDPDISRHGRTIVNPSGELELISSASFVEFQFEGELCKISLRNIAQKGEYNYVSVEIDDEYQGRLRVSGDKSRLFTIKPLKESALHTLRIYKATEAHTGVVAFGGVQALDIEPVAAVERTKIEFIGNSITCGMGNDSGEIPCGRNKWYDQHNAYWSYASIAARALNADFMLSSVSGAGIYRNWNSDGPTVPRQYESAYLHIDSTLKWDFSNWIPDVVVIALGTNDLSDGDGEMPRLPFDSTAFINEYVGFVGTIHSHYPDSRLVLLSSPMHTGAKSDLLLSCLESVKKLSELQHPALKQISVFRFESVTATGCSGHPDISEHKLMAEQLIPFMKGIVADF